MTKEEILAMEAGRRLDGLVAKEVMGIEVEYPFAEGFPYRLVEEKGKKAWDIVALYSTDISAAWQVVDVLAKQNLFCSIDYLREQHWRNNKGDWRCRVVQGVKIEFAVAGEAPEAICKAALLIKLGAKK